MMQEEVIEFAKGDYKTILVLKFASNGRLISYSSSCIQIAESALMEELKHALFVAIENEYFEEAKKIQDQINKLRSIQEQKPTL